MRLESTAPTELDADQGALREEMAPVTEQHVQGFVSHRSDGALVGPFAPMLRWPACGRGAWQQARSHMDTTVLPNPLTR